MSINEKKIEEVEETLYSENRRKQIKQKDFRQYLVDRGIVLSFIKFILSLRVAENRPENPMDALKDYFGEFRAPEWDDIAKLEDDVEALKTENESLVQKIEDMERLKEELIEKKRLREIEKQQKLAEEEAKKTKKAGKK